MSERYVIRKKIADGGMAEIFLASQLGAEGFDRPVVLKRILPEFSAHAQFRDMLVDEAHIAMSLNHTNIVPVLDLGQANGLYFLAMELVDGWDLSTILQRASSAALALPPGLALYITAEVCRGLAYAHGRKQSDGRPMGIIHRDISPQNVLVSEQGEVKVTDFGIAKAFVKRDRTQVGIIKGKLEFMSPEQAAGAPLGAASDIFSVGTMLYMLTSGQRPFNGPTDYETFLKVRKATCLPLEEANPNLTPEVVAIVKRAMQPPPSQRYASADEMMAELEEVIRMDFGSAGRSELKRWLAELSKRDGAPPISGRPGLPMKAGQGALELGDNSVITLKDTVPESAARADGGVRWTAGGAGRSSAAAAHVTAARSRRHAPAGGAHPGVSAAAPGSRSPARVPGAGHRGRGRGSCLGAPAGQARANHAGD